MKMKKIKKSTIVEAQKRKKKILEFYYMTPEKTNAKELTTLVTSVDEEKVDVWPGIEFDGSGFGQRLSHFPGWPGMFR